MLRKYVGSAADARVRNSSNMSLTFNATDSREPGQWRRRDACPPSRPMAHAYVTSPAARATT